MAALAGGGLLSPGEPPSALPAPEWRLGRATVIVPRDGPDAIQRFGPMVISAAGAIYVADLAEARIGVFDSLGRRMTWIGRRGRGPGEFLDIRSLGFSGDSLWVYDPAQLRITFWSLAGKYRTSVAQDRFTHGRVASDYRVHGLMKGGAALVAQTRRPPTAPDRGVDPLVFELIHGAKGTPDTLLVADMSHDLAYLWVAAGPVGTQYQPFRDGPLSGPSPEGDVYVVVHREAPRRGQSGQIRVLRTTFPDRRVTRQTIEFTPSRVPPGTVDSLLESFAGHLVAMRIYPNTQAAIRELRRRVFLPGWYPPISDARLDREGRLWLAGPAISDRSGRQPTRWSVYAVDGRLLGVVSLPAQTVLLTAYRKNLFVLQADSEERDALVRFEIE